ncbi:MAG: pseudouridine synthase [Lachnospiraceae bacterium]|jgi:23S rRNA pseudouridine2604 synthase|nr:pseudouridine synthase [Lachnospiraceae bacterium]
MEEPGIRLNKYLSEAGVCSRREADRLVEAGRVTVDGKTAVMGQRVDTGRQVCLDGKPVGEKERPVLLLVNKPAGIVCTTAEFRGEKNIVDLVRYPIRLYPVGRLDKESEGLILMTNQGDLMNKILRPGNAHEKEYLVEVNRPVTAGFLEAMRRGVPILGTVTAPCQAEKTGQKSFRMVLTQGLNRQIRRMCEYFDYRVTGLKRVRIMHFTLDGIATGGYREATEAELSELSRLLTGSGKGPEPLRRNKDDRRRK